jgi:hypothetical protein
MFCSNCGASLQDGSKFCSNCGVSLNSVNENTVTTEISATGNSLVIVERKTQIGGIAAVLNIFIDDTLYVSNMIIGSNAELPIANGLHRIYAIRPAMGNSGEWISNVITFSGNSNKISFQASFAFSGIKLEKIRETEQGTYP